MLPKLSVPNGYRVFRQSNDYLYGWNWVSVDDKGYGYSTRKSAIEAAIRHSQGKGK